MTHEEIKEKAHLDVFLPKNEPIVKEINNWIHEFMFAEDMDAYWQNSLIHLIFEIRHQALAEERESVRKEIEFVKTNIACHRTRGIDADSGDDARQIGWDGACDLILSSQDKPLIDK